MALAIHAVGSVLVRPPFSKPFSGKITDDVSLICNDSTLLEWAVFTPKNHPYYKAVDIDTWAASIHVAVAGQGIDSPPFERFAKKLSISVHILAYAHSFTTALKMAGECHALSTILRQPF